MSEVHPRDQDAGTSTTLMNCGQEIRVADDVEKVAAITASTLSARWAFASWGETKPIRLFPDPWDGCAWLLGKSGSWLMVLATASFFAVSDGAGSVARHATRSPVNSVSPARNLAKKSLPKLSDYGPRFALLDENEAKVRAYLAQAFPDRFNCDTPLGSGALIWIADGKPIQCAGGPNVTEYERLKTSRSLWATVTD